MKTKQKRTLKELNKKKFLSKEEKRKLFWLELVETKRISVKECKVLKEHFVDDFKFDLAGPKRQVGQKNVFRFRGGKKC